MTSFFLHQTDNYPCAYLSEATASSKIVLPPDAITAANYARFLEEGFRRSGFVVYRPACDACTACLSLRLPVANFAMNRSQKRALLKNAALKMEEVPLRFDEAHYELYMKYQKTRHLGGGMDQDSIDDYIKTLLQTPVDTRLFEFRHQETGALLMVSVVDMVQNALSAVYAFFDPETPDKSLGTYHVLQLIHYAKSHALPYVYLGYFIESCRKMAYKANFFPHETLAPTDSAVWQLHSKDTP